MQKYMDLHCTAGSSDKVYHAAVIKDAGGYVVNFAYGRRGTALNMGTKTNSPVPLEKAEKIFERLVAEKIAKGYVPASGISGNVFGIASNSETSAAPAPIPTSAKKQSGLLPQLLNPCTYEDVKRLIEDPAWGAQEKMNGVRLMVRASGSTIEGINRKGMVVPLMPAVASAVKALGADVVLDGESIGDTLHVFGLLEYAGKDLRHMPYAESFKKLSTIAAEGGEGLSLVPLATSEKEKLEVYTRVQEEDGEGIVFKKLSSPYSQGRPSSGGDQLKYKFWSTCSAVVLAVNDKRSVQLGVYKDGSDKLMGVGNAAIPANYDIPKKGDVVEVRYLYAYQGGSLHQPIYEGTRSDIEISDCAASQLKHLPAAA